jgi:tetratricopeptide (TPR) repeat protein
MVLTHTGLHRHAEASFRRGVRIARARGDRPLEGVLRANYGECLLATERWDDAAAELTFALGVAREGEDRAREGQAMKLLGVLEGARGRLHRARILLGEALSIGRELDDRLLVAETLTERGALLCRHGRAKEALRDWDDAEERFAALEARRDAERVRRMADELRPDTTGNGTTS